MNLILGVDDFGKAYEQRLNFIDKSLFIKEVFDQSNLEATVIIRPRRFGKTFNLSMLHHFLAAQVHGLKTKAMFDGLKIAKAGDRYMREQGQYPVIFISFKSLKKQSFTHAYGHLIELMSQTYRQHDYLLESSSLRDYEKKTIERFITKSSIEPSLLENALYELSHCLFKHHGIKPWLLMDEYDTPLQAAYLNDYYQPMMEVIRSLFSAVLKGNSNIYRAVITGILRIAKENLFSGVNHLKVYSILNDEYAEHFGFTEEEVDDALAQAGLMNLSSEVKMWYNGYRMGTYQIYNPWSIANCIHEKGALKPYWVNTSDNLLIKQTIASAEVSIKEKLELILAGHPIKAWINENTLFSDLSTDNESIWGLLLLSGYLTTLRHQRVGLKNECILVPPNQEIKCLYPDMIVSWFLDRLGEDSYHWLLRSLITGDTETFLEILQKFLQESVSYFDMSGKHPEKFYHGLVLGLMVSLSKTHHIHSNKESGYGCYDVLLIPKDPEQLGLVIEFKVGKLNQSLQETAENALTQIDTKNYTAELRQQGIQRILKIGLGFLGKEVELASSFCDERC